MPLQNRFGARKHAAAGNSVLDMNDVTQAVDRIGHCNYRAERFSGEPMKHVKDGMIIVLLFFTVLCAAGLYELLSDIDDTVKVAKAEAPNTIKLLNKDLVDAKDLIVHADQTADAARQASKLELKELPKITGEIETTLHSVNGVALSVSRTSDAISSDAAVLTGSAAATLSKTQTAIAGIQPVEIASTEAVLTIKQSAIDLDRVVADPEIPKTLKNLDAVTDNTAATMGNVKAMSGEAREWLHNTLHPKWPARVWGYIKDAGVTAAKVVLP